MAAVGRGGGSSALRPIEISDSDSDSSQFVTDSDSDDSFDMDQVVCEYRTAEYYNDECSRYLDCPSHLAQRDTQEGEIRDGEDKAGDVEMTDVGDGESRGAMSSAPAEVDLAGGLGTATDPIVLQDSPVQQRIRPGLHTRRSIQSDGASGTDQPSPVNADSRQDRVGGTWRSSLRDARPARSNAVPAPLITLPRWQPDSEVTYCPICFTQFGMFVRKHHCRKCGRVVCNTCSPHRITIPHQYIVRPPGVPVPTMPQNPEAVGSRAASPHVGALGGGESVRLCNPCVPDPNTAPPQAHQEHQPRPLARSHSNHLASNPLPNRFASYFGPAMAGDSVARNRSVTMAGPPWLGMRQQPSYLHTHGPEREQGLDRRLSAPQRQHDAHGAGPGPASYLYHRQQRQRGPSVASRQVAEEDECPICHRELPSRTRPNYEAERVAHINECIGSHSGAGGSGSGTDRPGGSGTSSSPRRTGMFPYMATEKDCVDEAECTICLEEFEVGDRMARLECLCRFHKHCIDAWWRRNPNRCPVHHHDSFGY